MWLKDLGSRSHCCSVLWSFSKQSSSRAHVIWTSNVCCEDIFNDENAQRPPQFRERHRKLGKHKPKEGWERKKARNFAPHPDYSPNHTPTYPNPPWWNTGRRTSWTQKLFFECRERKGLFRVEISFFFQGGSLFGRFAEQSPLTQTSISASSLILLVSAARECGSLEPCLQRVIFAGILIFTWCHRAQHGSLLTLAVCDFAVTSGPRIRDKRGKAPSDVMEKAAEAKRFVEMAAQAVHDTVGSLLERHKKLQRVVTVSHSHPEEKTFAPFFLLTEIVFS